MVISCLREVQSFLKSETEELDVVVMPDFFIDRLVNLEWDLRAFSGNLESVSRRKGGSIDGIRQTELRGGNAINTASALAALGVKVTPIVCTNKLGLELIRFYLKRFRINLSHIKVFQKPSITTAMELKDKTGKVNVMLRDTGALANFGPHHLTDDDFEAIENADYVCLFNWAGTRRFGTELANTVFRRAKTKGRAKVYFDTADPTPNKAKIPNLMSSVLQSKNIDILSINENEATCYAAQLSSKTKSLGRGSQLEELAKESAKILASHLPARIDLHTTSFSATFTRKSETIVPAFKVPALRATGAGDAWNAGNILGDANKLSQRERLTLANAVAAYYISDKGGMHPTLKQLARFIEKCCA
jgi:sugar/nucleoside kinase (ribokinase family)